VVAGVGVEVGHVDEQCRAGTGRHLVQEFDLGQLDAVLDEIGFTTVAKLHWGVRGADTERVVLLYLLQKP
jgi:hypothetical protein